MRQVRERAGAPVRSRSSLLFGPTGGISLILCSLMNHWSIKVSEWMLTGLNWTPVHSLHYCDTLLWYRVATLFVTPQQQWTQKQPWNRRSKRHYRINTFYFMQLYIHLFLFCWEQKTSKLVMCGHMVFISVGWLSYCLCLSMQWEKRQTFYPYATR